MLSACLPVGRRYAPCGYYVVGQIPVGDEILTKTLGLNLSPFSKRMGFLFTLVGPLIFDNLAEVK